MNLFFMAYSPVYVSNILSTRFARTFRCIRKCYAATVSQPRNTVYRATSANLKSGASTVGNENQDPNVRTMPPEEGSPADNIASVDPVDSAALKAQCDRLAADKAELNDRLLRRQADFENYR